VTWLSDSGSEFVASARHAIRTARGSDYLRGLGWWDLLDDLGNAEAREAAFALFEAQGREGSDAPALNALLAQPYVAIQGSRAEEFALAIDLRSSSRPEKSVILGDSPASRLLVDMPGHGAFVATIDDVRFRALDNRGGHLMRSVEFDTTVLSLFLDERQASVARARSLFLGRVAVAHELLGAALQTLELAVEHASSREQFGQAIGRFQAVRHLLSWAAVECFALRAVCTEAVRLDVAAPPLFGSMVKALAGRNARRTCEHTLQVMGAIGFTAEHSHHDFHARVLVLDSLLGGSDELTCELGLAARQGVLTSDVSRSFLTR
jgi:hypothetical protein